MDAPIVRCPFCVAENDFRRMRLVEGGRYACVACWHVTEPKNKDFECQCVRCIGLRARVKPVSHPAHWPMREQQNAARPSKRPASGEIPDGLPGVSKLA